MVTTGARGLVLEPARPYARRRSGGGGEIRHAVPTSFAGPQPMPRRAGRAYAAHGQPGRSLYTVLKIEWTEHGEAAAAREEQHLVDRPIQDRVTDRGQRIGIADHRRVDRQSRSRRQAT